MMELFIHAVAALRQTTDIIGTQSYLLKFKGRVDEALHHPVCHLAEFKIIHELTVQIET
jgi:hypothetical protein